MDPEKQSWGFRGEEDGRGGNRVMGIEAGTCCGEHWGLYSTNESLNTAARTNYVLYSG